MPSTPSIFHIATRPEPDKKLTDWLKEQGADSETIDKVKYITLNTANIVSFPRLVNNSVWSFCLNFPQINKTEDSCQVSVVSDSSLKKILRLTTFFAMSLKKTFVAWGLGEGLICSCLSKWLIVYTFSFAWIGLHYLVT